MYTFKELSRETKSMTDYSKKSFNVVIKPQTKKDDSEIIGTTQQGEERKLYTFLIPRRTVNGIPVGRSQFVSFWAGIGLDDTTATINPNLCEIDIVKTSRTDTDTGETEEFTNVEAVFLDDESIILADAEPQAETVKQPSLADELPA